MFIYREDYYMERDKPVQNSIEKQETFLTRVDNWQKRLEAVRNVAECVIGKQRHGPTGIVPVHFEGQFTRFSDLTRYYEIRED